jgi:hypothetical protein
MKWKEFKDFFSLSLVRLSLTLAHTHSHVSSSTWQTIKIIKSINQIHFTRSFLSPACLSLSLQPHSSFNADWIIFKKNKRREISRKNKQHNDVHSRCDHVIWNQYRRGIIFLQLDQHSASCNLIRSYHVNIYIFIEWEREELTWKRTSERWK